MAQGKPLIPRLTSRQNFPLGYVGKPPLSIEQIRMTLDVSRMPSGIRVEAKTKLADRSVTWQEAYTDKTLFLKRQYHDTIGPGSYFRFEGHDAETGDDYFVIVGPAKVHSPSSQFFAGVRKMPADYPAAGQSFHDMKEAIEHANRTWGTPIPDAMRYYDSGDLKGIGGKIKKWKEEYGDEHDADSLRKWYESLPKEGAMPTETTKEANTGIEYIYVQSDVYPFFEKVAMATWLRQETGFSWWDIDDLVAGTSRSFEREAETQPSLVSAKDFALNERTKRRTQIAEFYGSEYMEADFYKIWLTHRGDRGTYIVSVGPYCGQKFENAQDKFGVFTWKLNLADPAEIDKKVQSLIKEYAEKFGVELTGEDINVPLADHPMVGEISIKKSGKDKIYGSPEWKRQILDHYGVQPGRGMTKQLRDKARTAIESWKQQLDAAYAESQENGEAFERMQPKPPDINLSRRHYGQQQPTTIYRENIKPEDENMTIVEKVEKYGFDSIREAVDHLTATVMQGAPVGDVPDTTSRDLANARAKENRAKQKAEQSGKPEVHQVRRQRTVKEKPAVEPVKEPSKAPFEAKPQVAPQETGVPDFSGAVNFEGEDDDETLAGSVNLMSKMASELESMGMQKASEGIRSVIKKYGEKADTIRAEAAREIGSQRRDTLEESGMRLVKRIDASDVILAHADDERLPMELWTMRDDFAGYVIEIDGKGYEFVRTWLQPRDSQTAGVL